MLEYSKEQAMDDKAKIDMTIYELQAEISKTLAHPIRLAILHSLRDGEKTVNELTEMLGARQSNLSQHLSLMVSSGILLQRKEGTGVYYKLATEKIATACRIMREVLIENLKKQSELITLMEN